MRGFLLVPFAAFPSVCRALQKCKTTIVKSPFKINQVGANWSSQNQ
jgi:hypothetical protein